jgi:hypothetical protein
MALRCLRESVPLGEALARDRVGGLCAFDQTGLGWLGPDHCWACHGEGLRLSAEFDQGVREGRWDTEGYTPKDRKAQVRRSQCSSATR